MKKLFKSLTLLGLIFWSGIFPIQESRSEVINSLETTQSEEGSPVSSTITYVNKTGKVYSANPGSSKFTATTDEVTIKVSKTGGKAETQVSVYVNGVFTKKIEFDNGRYTSTKTKTISGVRNKEVKVKIVNQSLANTFSYRLVCTGVETNVCPKVLENYNGTVYAGGPKRFTLTPKCGNLELRVSKTGGKAETQVSVYVNNVFQQNKKMEFDNGRYSKTKTVTLHDVMNKTVRVEIVNQSVTNKFKYRFTAVQKE